MNAFRKILVVVAALLLPLSLLTFGSLFSSLQAFGKPDAIKAALDESKIYDSLVRDMLGRAQQDPDSLTSNQIPIEDPQVQQVIEQAFPPDFLQQQTEGVLDNAYAWLRGESATLSFQIDMTEAKVRLADGLANYADQRLSTLPACTAADQIPAEFDIFSATCLPPGFDKNVAVNEVRTAILTNKDFLEDPQLTAADVKDSEGRPLEQQLGNVPETYAWMLRAMWTAAILAVLTTITIIVASSNRRAGLGRVGKVFISIGAVSALLAWVSSILLGKLTDSVTKAGDTEQLQARLLDAVTLLTSDLRNWWLGYGLTLVALGIGALVARRIIAETAPLQPPMTPPSATAAVTSSESPTTVTSPTPTPHAAGAPPLTRHRK